MKNILLVYPEVPNNTYWSFKYALKFVNKMSAMPPLGLITVAALFPEEYNLKLIDLNIEPLQEKEIIWADAVFVSAMIVQKDSLQEVVSFCNRLETPVIAGGPYPTSSHEEINGVDHFVLGEVEDTFKDILTELENGTAKRVYPRPERPDVSRSVIPRFDLLDLDSYSSMSVQYSRGCPFKCEFCDIWTVYGNKPRVKNHENFIAELEMLYNLGWRGAVFVVDDNFIGNKHSVKKELLPALIEWQKSHDYVFRFFTEASINMADDKDLLSAMKNAGFNEVFIGIETPAIEGLKETDKLQNIRTDMHEAVRTIQNHGMGVMAGFILGFDSDSDDIFDRQISFIQKAGIPRAMVGLLTVLPGTRLFDRLEREGRLKGVTDGNNTHNMETNFITKMDALKLKEGYQKVLSTIYDSNLKNYFARCNRLLDNIGNSHFFSRQIHLKELRMLFKSLFRQSFTPYGYQYLKFVIRNYLKHSKTFSEAIALCITGHHYYTITQETLKIEKISLDLEEGYSYLREQINSYSAILKNNYKDGIQNVIELWNQRKDLLEDIRKKIDKIHVDFREDISIKYNEVAKKMENLFNTFEDDLMKHGIGV